MAKMVIPPRKLVIVSMKLIIMASLNGAKFESISHLNTSTFECNVPVNILSERVVAGKHDNRTETHGKGKETLTNGRVPSLLFGNREKRMC